MAISANLVNELRQKTGAGMMDCKRALTETGGDMEKAIMYLRQKGLASASKKAARVAAEGKVEARTRADGRQAVIADINCETDFVARGEEFLRFIEAVVAGVLQASEADLAKADLFETLRQPVVAKTGENVVVRRFSRFDLQGHGRIETYMHMGGKIGVMVELGASSAAAEADPKFLELCREIAMHVAAANPQYLAPADVPATVVESERALYLQQAIDAGKPAPVAEKMVDGRLKKYYGEFCLLEQPWVREQKKTIQQLLDEVSAAVGGKVSIHRYTRYQLGEGIEKKTSDLAAEVQAQIAASEKA